MLLPRNAFQRLRPEPLANGWPGSLKHVFLKALGPGEGGPFFKLLQSFNSFNSPNEPLILQKSVNIPKKRSKSILFQVRFPINFQLNHYLSLPISFVASQAILDITDQSLTGVAWQRNWISQQWHRVREQPPEALVQNSIWRNCHSPSSTSMSTLTISTLARTWRVLWKWCAEDEYRRKYGKRTKQCASS